MSVNVGKVETFPNPKADKAQVLKVLEEAAEAYSAWENLRTWLDSEPDSYRHEWRKFDLERTVSECADLIQATCNLLAALGVEDMEEPMRECWERNRTRGRC